MLSEYYATLIAGAAGFAVSYLSTYLVAEFARRKGLVSEDAHKKTRCMIPSIGGLGSIIGIVTSLILLIALVRDPWVTRLSIVCMLVVLFGCGVGLIDDVYRLEGPVKVLLMMVPFIFVIASKTYVPYMDIPFIGTVRLTIVYPLIVMPLAFTVSSNAINMMDTLNGLAPITVLILLFDIMIASIIGVGWLSPWTNALFPILFVITLSIIGYLPHNLYPSRVFNGDTGSLAWGALLAYLAIVGKTEVFLVMAAMPAVANGFAILASIKGFVEHGKIPVRPTIVDRERNVLRANPDPKAPITLIQLVTLKNTLRENEIVASITLLLILTSIVTIIFYIIYM